MRGGTVSILRGPGPALWYRQLDSKVVNVEVFPRVGGKSAALLGVLERGAGRRKDLLRKFGVVLQYGGCGVTCVEPTPARDAPVGARFTRRGAKKGATHSAASRGFGAVCYPGFAGMTWHRHVGGYSEALSSGTPAAGR